MDMATFASAPREWSRGLWEYYRGYTRHRVAVHAAATAGLTAFGLLATLDRLFIVVAIVAYVLPPVYLYLAGDEFETDPKPATDATHANRADVSAKRATDADGGNPDGDTDTDTDSDDGDTDNDDGDTDSDGADADTDG